MERVWAPWRGDYVTALGAAERGASSGGAAKACVFCSLLAGDPKDDCEHLIVHRGEHAFVLMNLYPYNNGHVLVLPNAHQGELEALDRAAFEALNRMLLRAVAAVRKGLAPHGMNLGMNLGRAAGAGIPDHLHHHIVPRWDGDTNFMPTVSETKVISQHILKTYDLIKQAFDA